MKNWVILGMMIMPFLGIAQTTTLYNYHEKGDTVYINGKRLIPGDTLHLGYGSNADKSFNYIWEMPAGEMNGASEKYKYLPKNYCAGFLIYSGRVDQGFGMMKLYLPVFYDPANKKVKYNVLFLKAVEKAEVRL